jgi:hypothetical protein
MSLSTMRLTSLHVTSLLQTRANGVCKETVTDYTAAAKDGAVFPELLAFRITDRKFPGPALVAGFHRHAAYKAAGVEECRVDVREGTFAEAWLAGWLSNLSNGLRYTNPDKRKAAEQALLLFRDDSAPSVAEKICVSDEFVRKVRKELIAVGKIEQPETVTAKDGAPSGPKLKPPSEETPTVGVSSDGLMNDEPPEEEHDAREPEPPPPLDDSLPQPSINGAKLDKPSWFTEGGKAIPDDHPFKDILNKFTALTSAITTALRKATCPYILDALREAQQGKHHIPMLFFTDDKYDRGEVKEQKVKFIALHALRRLFADVGEWKQKRPAGKAAELYRKALKAAEGGGE